MEQLLKKYTMNRKERRFNDPSDIDSIAHYNKRYKLNQERENELEETGDSQDGLINGINNLGLNSLNVRNTRFVINTTAVVPEHDFSEDSSDEEVDEYFNWSFDERSCVKGDFPFTPITKTTSKDKTKDIILENKLAPLDVRTNSQIVDVFLNKLLQNGFDEDEKNNKMSTIAVSAGLNRMYSVSSRKNKLLNLELQSAVNHKNIKYEKFGFYWKCKWYNNDGKEVEFANVRKFYKKLKKVNPDLAKRFVLEEQAFARNRENVPYQDIREFAKNHKMTKKLIIEFRENNSNAIIYLSLIDADVLDFNGIYSAYLRIIDGCNLIPTIMTTGYEYPNYSSAFELSSHMDRMIRVITASHIPLGTYYPEPNMCILVPQNSNTVPESFIDRKRGKTLESPILLTNIQSSRGKAVRAIFSEDNPVILTIPQRAKINKKSKTDYGFSCVFTEGPARPSKSDIDLFAQVSQSNNDNLIWLTNLFINKAIKYDKNYKTDAEECDENIIKLPARVYHQCKTLITKMKYNENVHSFEQLKFKLAIRIGMDDANNIAKLIEAIKKYNKYFYEQHQRTPEEQELIDIMRERSADIKKLPKGFLLRIVTSPLMPLIKNDTVDIATLCKQNIEVLERFVDDDRISKALEDEKVEFKDLIDCLDQDISDIDNPIAALLMEVEEPMKIVHIHPEITEYAFENDYINVDDICSQDDINPEILGYAFESGYIDNDDVCDIVYHHYELLEYTLKNGYIDYDDVRKIKAEILGDRDDCAAAQEFDRYWILATESRDDYYDDDFDLYEDRAD